MPELVILAESTPFDQEESQADRPPGLSSCKAQPRRFDFLEGGNDKDSAKSKENDHSHLNKADRLIDGQHLEEAAKRVDFRRMATSCAGQSTERKKKIDFVAQMREQVSGAESKHVNLSAKNLAD